MQNRPPIRSHSNSLCARFGEIVLKSGTGQGQAGVYDSQPLMLDRDAELTAITAAITAAAGGRGTLIVVQGPAGIGKTTILRAACAEAGAQGMRT